MEHWICRATANLSAGMWDIRYTNYELTIAPTGDYGRLHYVNGVAKEYCSMAIIPAKLCPLLGRSDKGVTDSFMNGMADEFGVLFMRDFIDAALRGSDRF